MVVLIHSIEVILVTLLGIGDLELTPTKVERQENCLVVMQKSGRWISHEEAIFRCRRGWVRWGWNWWHPQLTEGKKQGVQTQDLMAAHHAVKGWRAPDALHLEVHCS